MMLPISKELLEDAIDYQLHGIDRHTFCRQREQLLRDRLRATRRSRTRAAIAALAIGVAIGGIRVDQQAPETPIPVHPIPVADQACGRYPDVALRRDCGKPTPARARRLHRNPRLECIRSIETGGRYTATSPSGTYRGAYQFSRSTWASVGPNRFDRIDPARAPRWLQDQRARRLLRLRGTQPWPPARSC